MSIEQRRRYMSADPEIYRGQYPEDIEPYISQEELQRLSKLYFPPNDQEKELAQ
jgi:hypothetical protein